MGKPESPQNESSREIEILRLERRPLPLVSNLLTVLRNLGVPELDIQVIFYNSAFKKAAESYLLSLAVREAGDQTAILGPLIGVSKSPEDTREILTTIGNNLLKELEEKDLKERVLAVLQGQLEDNIKVFLAIDDLVGKGVRRIRQIAVDRGLANSRLNDMTFPAFSFWLKNRLVLKKLANLQGKEPWQLLNLELVHETDIFGEKRTTDISQQPIIPQINADPLLEILPPELNRKINREPPPIYTPLGFISRLFMAGNPLFRVVVSKGREYLESRKIIEKLSPLP